MASPTFQKSPSAKLVIMEPGSAKTELSISIGSNVIGRRIEGNRLNVDIELPGTNISRRHVRLELDKTGRCELVDLESKNGTYVNGLRAETVSLTPNDIIGVGNYKLQFVPVGLGMSAPDTGDFALKSASLSAGDASPLIELTDNDASIDMQKTILRPVAEIMRPFAAGGAVGLPEELTAESPKVSLLTKRTRMLSVLYKASKALISAVSLDDLLETVMDLVFENVDAKRGVMVFVDEETGEWIPKKARYVDGEKTHEKIVISKSIAGIALKEKKAVLITDALLDPGLKRQESIRMLGIRSAMCVPVSHLDNMLGFIYLDTSEKFRRFTQDDLDMITALSAHAAMAISQAQLNDKLREQENFRRQMARYHSPAVIDRIMQRPENALEVHEAYVTILFSDITDFTVFCDRHEPAVVRSMLNEYFSEMTEVIFKREGTLDKYIADEILAVFGVPFSHDDDPERALLTALEMREALSKLNARRPLEMRFQAKIGINSGKVLVGDIGCLKRMDYTILGAPVNTAKRIETTAKPDQILVGPSTYNKISDKVFDLRPTKAIPLKGRSTPVQLYELIGIR
ncbi:MAG: GAF domain-containing protein [Candidatus Coatesbacteria bacterium]|nr:GAF domain-containing protein [Candidatus Coatesbacteria bacterium]